MQALMDYLKEAKARSACPDLLKICLGNISTDLDSCVGSILLAYFLTRAKGVFFVPVINGSMAKLQTQKTLTHHFDSCQVLLELLVYFDEISAPERVKSNQLEIVLYDHNELDPAQEYLLPCIKAIYDHHIDLTKDLKAEKLITFCGSAISLVLTQPFVNVALIDFDLARFAIAPIIFDTKNLAHELYKDRWNDIDKAAYKLLNEVLAPKGFDSSSYYEELKKISKDTVAILAQGMKVLIEKDYKSYKVKIAEGKEVIFGVSLIEVKLKKFLLHFGAVSLFKEFIHISKIKNLKYFIVLGCARKKSFRDFLVFTEDTEYLKNWTGIFTKKYEDTIGLIHMKKFDDIPQCSYYTYSKCSFTRKKLEPLWRDVTEQI
eukprot:TRINITY_DN9515_c0_g1_i9.p1 TRINITY_DN9515_c0_g1~~TRINITY_DN9515_c0_g1_i9.p1  ORF type:complete len:375 (-),score=75.41 TRINITY_DN9515_c0_g1_i9:125-1249(-)